ncbi:MAG TPA: STAS domain-containing protein [Polyangia bacterium]
MATAYYGQLTDTSVLRLAGQIRYTLARRLRAFVDDVIAPAGCDTVFIDLRQVDFIDSTGLGMVARIGRLTLESRGRRAAIVVAPGDVEVTLRSAGFDELFVMLAEFPYDPGVDLREIPLADLASSHDNQMGHLILDAHRDLAAVSEESRETFRQVIDSLEADLEVTETRS